ncbi:MAG: VanW family protein [Betaproteobacteria bacterium]
MRLRLVSVVLEIMVASVCLVAGTALGAGAFFCGSGGRVAPGVCLGGIEVGGATPAEAADIAACMAGLVNEKPIVLVHRDQRWERDLESLGAECDPDELARRLMEVGRTGSMARRVRELAAAAVAGWNVGVVTRVDEDRLLEAVLSLAAEINIEARNATFDVRTGRPVPERQGRRLDVAQAVTRIQEALALAERPTVLLESNEVRPFTTLRDLAELGIRELVASYSTTFDPQLESRGHNIRLASGRISGVMVRPGEEFSFNEVVGPRTREFGFLEAPEIVEDEFRPGIGGGVCQVSSTLYNAALLADMRITMRQSHSRLTGYVPPGRDATVYYGQHDLRFRNTGKTPVLIMSQVTGSKITVSIFGDRPEDREVRIVASHLESIPPGVREIPDAELAEGERVVEKEGAPGCEVVTERLVIVGGRVERREVLSRDRYRAQDAVIRVGTRSRSTPPGVREP